MFDLDDAYESVSAWAGHTRSSCQFDDEHREIIFTHDLSGNLTFLNRAGELISGYSQQEACGMNIAQFVAPEFAERVRDGIEGNSIERLGTVYEIDIIAKTGRRIALEVSTQVVVRDGQPLAIEGIAFPSVLRNPSQLPTRLRCQDEEFSLSG